MTKLLMVGHSYVVTLNRRLCQEVALAGGPELDVTVAAPASFQGDLGPIQLESPENEPFKLVGIPTSLSKIPHVFSYGRALKKLLQGQRWDIVHVWEEPYIFAGAQLAWWTPPRSTLIYSSFQNQPKKYPPPFNLFERYCLKRAAGWTAFGDTVAHNLKDRPGYRERPSRTIPVGVDLDVFQPDAMARQRVLASLGWKEEGPPIIGYLGRFVPQKGLPMLMRVLNRLDPTTWRAMIVGGGAMEAELREWASRFGDSVKIVTGVNHDEVPAHLNAMDLLVAPSQTTPAWREQFGRMLVEAMGVGVPIVASDSGEIPNVVSNAGLIIPEADESAWVIALQRLLQNRAQRHELRVRGRTRAKETFAWPTVAQQYLDFFMQLREGSQRISETQARS
ncbi:glycosyltransferase family 4 protein [Singulisphaera sp. PoT]|uniref:glycosyltransferase family 4 protein n=1 Tax=Singulisphaera sp. PoT TaxID=3411797 RepID=UPI003BF5ED56